MDITIAERIASIGSDFDIATPAGNYFAHKSALASMVFCDSIELNTAAGASVGTMHGGFSPFRDRHEIALSDGRTYQFWCEKLLKQVYRCQGNGEKYEFYEHRGLKFSIFKDGAQIAAVTKNSIVLGNANRYHIRMNSDADPVVILCMVLTACSGDRNNGATVTLDFGRIGPEGRPWDPDWQPR